MSTDSATECEAGVISVFVYEFLTAGAWQSAYPAAPVPASLLREGSAMLEAIAVDLGRAPGVRVATIIDQHWLTSSSSLSLPSGLTLRVEDRAEGSQWHPAQPQPLDCCTVHESTPATELALFRELAAAADWTLVIAPEIDGHLLNRCQLAKSAGGRLLGPSEQCVALASDKHLTARHMAEHGLTAPRGRLISASDPLPADFDYPAVLKRLDGAGSQDVVLINTPGDARGNRQRPMRLEAFVPGTAASVAVLCGPSGNVALPACRQCLSADGRFEYLGGELPLEPGLAERATRLALAAVDSLPGVLGYIGVDLVLGIQAEQDTIIEVNPRLTTSYIGLRQACQQNLAWAMLEIAAGRPADLSYYGEPLQFDATGCVSVGT